MKIIDNLLRRHLDRGEKMHLVVHRHWITIVRKVLFWIVIGIILPLAIAIWSQLYLVAMIISLATFLYFAYHLADEMLDAWMITSQSIIDAEWNGFFHQKSTRIPYTEVREVSWEKSGVLSSILDFGDITISMATGGNVTLHDVGKPKNIELKILSIRDQMLRERDLQHSEYLQHVLGEIVAEKMSEGGFDF